MELNQHLSTLQNSLQPQNAPLPRSSQPVIDRCVCDGSGHFRIDIQDIHHPWFGKLFRCVCKQAEDLTDLQWKLGTPTLPVMLKDVVVSTADSRKMKTNAQHFITGLVTFYTVWGTNGSGKTTTLMAITNELMEQGTACVYVTAADVMEYIKAGIGDADRSAAARVDQIANLPILCLDELTQVRWTDYVSEQLETILDRRYRAGLRTAMAMDQDPEDVLPARFTSRMKSGAYIQIGDPDMRPLIAQQELSSSFSREALERGE